MKNFTMIPNEIIDDTRLTPREFKVLAALYSYRKKGTQLVYPKRETLSKRTGISIENISRITTHLEELGLLKKEGNGGRSRAIRYTLIVPSNGVKNDTVTNDVKNDMVNPNDVKNDRGIEHILNPTPAPARLGPRSGAKPLAGAGVGEEVIIIKGTTKPIVFSNDDPVKDNNEYNSSLDAKPDWLTDSGSGVAEEDDDGNSDSFSTIQQDTVLPSSLPRQGDTMPCHKGRPEWAIDWWFVPITELFPSTTPAQCETGHAVFLEWINLGYRPMDIHFEALKRAETHNTSADFLDFFGSISVLDQYTPEKA